MTHQPSSTSSVIWSASDLANDPHRSSDKACRVRAMFAAIAKSYDLNNRLHSFGRDQAWRHKAVRLCEVTSSDRVLDAACGTGDLAAAFAAAGAANVIGVDFTDQMLDIARDKAQHPKSSQEFVKPQYQHADVTELPFEDASFDIVSIAFGIRNVDDPARALGEFYRVLRKNGRLMILEFSEPKNVILRHLNTLYTQRIMPITATLLSRDRTGAYRYLPRSVRMFADRQELAAMMREARFSRVSLHPMTFGVCVGYLAHVDQCH